MSDLVGNPEDQFSHNEAQLSGNNSDPLFAQAFQSAENLIKEKGVVTVLWNQGRHVYMSLVVRKPVFGVSDLDRHKPGCAVTEDG